MLSQVPGPIRAGTVQPRLQRRARRLMSSLVDGVVSAFSTDRICARAWA